MEKQKSEQVTPVTPKFLVTHEQKKARPKIPKSYYDLADPALIEMITSAIRIQVPTFGIHRPQLWKNRDGWGVIYKILAEVPSASLKKSFKSNKYDIMQIKWKSKRTPMKGGDQLIPFRGYEGVAKSIDATCAMKLKEKLN